MMLLISLLTHNNNNNNNLIYKDLIEYLQLIDDINEGLFFHGLFLIF